MTFSLLLRRRAKADVRSAARWYERQRRGLGRDFIAEVERVLQRITENPFQCQVLHREARRGILHRFPFGVFYRIEGDKIVVFCVTHLHRDPTSSMGHVTKD